MRLPFSRCVLLCLLVAVGWGGSAAVTERESLRVAVVAPPGDDHHLAWAAATRLQHAAQPQGIAIRIEAAALTAAAGPGPDLYIMPVRSLATPVPAFQILELPFFYDSLAAVHHRVDGPLGDYLAAEARNHGWEVLAYWDEGMQVLSGLKRYDRVRNLKAREFLLTRPDPVAEKQFDYWKADARRIAPENREAVLRECVIASRAATLQEIWREGLTQVHLTVSLTNHRYEGWVLVAPVGSWLRLDDAVRQKLAAVTRGVTAWQREDAQRREAVALAALKKAGMTIYEVDSAERDAFRNALPDWAELLPAELGAQKKRELIELASPGATAVAGPASGPAAKDASSNPAPGADTR